jgi:hypothetical protein
MEKHNEHIANIEKLEDEIRKLSIPYVSEEPGPLYWANFRVRVMEQIAQKEVKAGMLDRVQQWVTGHIWGSSIAISAAAALLVAGVMIFNPSGGDTPLKTAVSTAPVATTPPVTSVPTVHVAKPDLAIVQEKPKAHDAVKTPPVYAAKHHEEASRSDLAMVGEPVSEPAANMVNLDDLSKTQLEAIVQDLESDE